MSNTTADAKEARAILQRVQNVLRDEDLLFAAESLRTVFEVIDGFTALQARVREMGGVLEECGEVLDNVRCYLGLCGPGDGGDRRADAPDNWGISHALDKARAALAKPEGGES